MCRTLCAVVRQSDSARTLDRSLEYELLQLHASHELPHGIFGRPIELALSIASISAVLLIRLGQLEAGADQAVFDALRQSPGLTT